MKAKIIFLIVPLLALWSCLNDDSDKGGRPISIIEFTDEFSEDPYSIEQFQTFTLDGLDFKQLNGDKPVTYRWDVDYKTVSTEKDLVYYCDQLSPGTTGFLCRYVVENEDGQSWKDFYLKVNGAFQEGILVLSELQGETYMTFKRQDVGNNTLTMDVYNIMNPDYPLGRPICMAQYQNNVIVCSDTRTMRLEHRGLSAANALTNPFDNTTWIASVPNGYNDVAFFGNGEIAEFDASQDGFMNMTQQAIRDDFPGAVLAHKGLYLNDLGALYFDTVSGTLLTGSYFTMPLEFYPGYSLVDMFAVSGYSQAVVVFKNGSGDIELVFVDPNNFMIGDPVQAGPGITDQTVYVGSQEYSEFYYSVGNNIYVTDYQNMDFSQPVKYTVGEPGDIIRAMSFDLDEERLYVAYDKPSGEMRGCVKCIVITGEREPWEETRIAGNILDIMYKRP